MRKFIEGSREFTLTVVGSDKDTIGEAEQPVLSQRESFNFPTLLHRVFETVIKKRLYLSSV